MFTDESLEPPNSINQEWTQMIANEGNRMQDIRCRIEDKL
jgi:hypothetical protein